MEYYLDNKTFYRVVLLLIAFIVVMGIATANAQQTLPIGNPTALNLSKGGFRADSVLQLPRKRAVWTWQDSIGRIYYDSVLKVPFYHNDTGWRQFGSGGSGITSLSQGYGLTNSPNPIIATGTQRIDTTFIIPFTDTLAANRKIVTTSFLSTFGYGTGTVTNFSSGNAAPLFTTSVATSTTTPALSFSITPAPSYSFLSNFTGSSTVPTYFQPTGTPSSTTFFRGDGTWATPLGSSYSAGRGLGLSGTTFYADTSILLKNVVINSSGGLFGTPAIGANTLGIDTVPLTLSSQSAWTLFGNNTSGSAAPTFSQPILASGLFNNQGSVSTLLHGNAAGNPSWTQVQTADIASNAVTYGKLQASTGSSLLIGSTSSGTTLGEIMLGTGLSMSGGTLSATGSGGTVTSFSSGNLSPLFTTSVATSTTTPAQSYSLTAAAAHTFFGNFTGSSSAPSYSSPSLASADFANQGTTTTLLHGNAAGNPSFGQVVTGDVATNAITYAKLQAATGSSLILGSPSTGSAIGEIVLGSGLSMSGSTLSATGSGGTVTSVTGTSPITSTGGSNPAIGLDETANYTWSGSHTFTNTGGVLVLQNGVSVLPGLTGILADFEGSANSFLADNTRNQSNGSNASGDKTVTADNGTNTSHYIDLGTNSSGYAQPGVSDIVGADGTYLYSQTDSMAIFTAANMPLIFGTGGSLRANARMTIGGTGTIWLPAYSNGYAKFISTTGQLSSSATVPFADIAFSGASTSFVKADGSFDPTTYLSTSTAASTYLPLAGGAMTGQITYAGAQTIASSTTVNLCSATSNVVFISGTTTIVNFGSCTTTNLIYVKFQGALTLTYNSTSMLLPGAVSKTTVANDEAVFENLGSGNWKCIAYIPYTVTGTGATVLAATQTLSGTLTQSGAITHTGTSLTSTCTTCTIGSATTATTAGIGTGATANATTKTVNVGTAGVSGSTTNVNIGSSVAGATNVYTIGGLTTGLGHLGSTGILSSSLLVNADITAATIDPTTKLSSTGTPSSTTYLRGDNTWAAIAGVVTTVNVTPPITSTGGTSPTIGFQTVSPFSVPANTTSTNATPAQSYSVTSTGGNSMIVGTDANGNTNVNNLRTGYQTIATAAGTTTATASTAYQTYFTGTSTQTYQLPVASTLTLGQQFQVVNNSTGIVTVNSSGGNIVQSMHGSGTSAIFTCILTSGTTAASWSVTYIVPVGIVDVVSGTSYTLVPSDNGIIKSFTNASAITLTVPTGLGATFNCTVQQKGSGIITPTASGTTLRAGVSGTTKSNGQYSQFSINPDGVTDEYIYQGNMQ